MQNVTSTQTSVNNNLGFKILIGIFFFEVFANVLLFSQPAARTDTTIVSLLIVGVQTMAALLAFSYALYKVAQYRSF